jgi:drug/metabolite transporter (DMT)-like permease
VVGWFFLDEILSAKSILGIVVSVSGIMIALAGKGFETELYPCAVILYALGGAAGQALGLILSKKGMGDYDAVAATQIRAIIRFFLFCPFGYFLNRWRRVFRTVNDGTSMRSITVGTIFGPFYRCGFVALRRTAYRNGDCLHVDGTSTYFHHYTHCLYV